MSSRCYCGHTAVPVEAIGALGVRLLPAQGRSRGGRRMSRGARDAGCPSGVLDQWIRAPLPQAFLTGTLQNYARKYKKPIDSIAFSVHVLGDRKADSITERPRDGIYVHGLFPEGARWDAAAQSLAEFMPKELFTPFPVMWMLPEEEKQVEPATAAAAATEQQALVTTATVSSVYKCPVYKILTRHGTRSTTGHSTNFVIFVNLPTKAPPSKWIKVWSCCITRRLARRSQRRRRSNAFYALICPARAHGKMTSLCASFRLARPSTSTTCRCSATSCTWAWC